MAETQTPNYHWIKPDIGGDATVWGTVLNTTIDAIDAVAFNNQTNQANYLPLTGGTLTGRSGCRREYFRCRHGDFRQRQYGRHHRQRQRQHRRHHCERRDQWRFAYRQRRDSGGAISGASLTASGSITTSGTVQGAAVSSTGDISASGNINTEQRQ